MSKNFNTKSCKKKGKEKDRRKASSKAYSKINSKLKGNDNETIKRGIFRGTGKGYAFFTPEDGGEDVFIPAKYVGSALNGDIVTVSVRKSADGRFEGSVKSIVEQSSKYIVGTFGKTEDGFNVITPDDKKLCNIFVIDDMNKLKPKIGYKVVGFPYMRDGDVLFGSLVEVLGEPDKEFMDLLSIAWSYGLSKDFPDEAEAQARNVNFEVTPEEMTGREDFRNKTVVTIDGLDAKDLDDAICVEKTDNGYELAVHIADVSHYVREDSPIDKEAYKRATSVYLPENVFPMLPRELSNGICSLNPNVNRLTLSCIMNIDNEGKVLNSRIVKGLIKTRKRMDYDTVAEILNGNAKVREENADVTDMLDTAKELALILNKKRLARGSVEFDLPESKVVLDEKGKCIDIKLYTHKISHKVIEEFMLIANETVAQTFDELGIPFVYRVHELPPKEKEERFIEYLKILDIKFDGGSPEAYANLLNSVKDSPSGKAINRIGLRSMAKAKYATKDSGHFGLAATYYCHFTSPIRRYPDLQIHRIISDYLSKGKSYVVRHYANRVADSAMQSSIREQIAMNAERKALDIKKAEYMKSHIGETFKGIISSVTEWGMFVELPNTIEGLIRMEALSAPEYNSKALIIIDNGEHYYIGKELEVVCTGVNEGKIDFDLPCNVKTMELESRFN